MKVSDEEVSWATPEAKAVLDWAEACLPMMMERIGEGRGSQVIRAYLASIGPKTVTLPERYVVDDGHGTWAFERFQVWRRG